MNKMKKFRLEAEELHRFQLFTEACIELCQAKYPLKVYCRGRRTLGSVNWEPFAFAVGALYLTIFYLWIYSLISSLQARIHLWLIDTTALSKILA